MRDMRADSATGSEADAELEAVVLLTGVVVDADLMTVAAITLSPFSKVTAEPSPALTPFGPNILL